MNGLELCSALLRILLTLVGALYGYHILYTVLGLVAGRRARDPEASPRRYAALCCARNEQAVIGQLVESLRAQNYPQELLDIYVMADNCTDRTAEAARNAGATHVFTRTNRLEVGKGYALDALLHGIWRRCGGNVYDGYFVFDADNLLDPDFVREMNNTFAEGHPVVTSYRNSKNFSTNWISYSYALWYLHEGRFLSSPRRQLGSCCTVSGTGFLVSGSLLQELGGWPYHMLTEDIQFSADCAARGIRIQYCNSAMVYDEQPQRFDQSWRQRLRWSRGFYEVDMGYIPLLLRGMVAPHRTLAERFSCFDMLMFILPGTLFSIIGAMMAIVTFCAALQGGGYQFAQLVQNMASQLLRSAAVGYVCMFATGLLTALSEWDRIPESSFRKLCYLPLFPLFMATYLPISLQALFCKVEWRPIHHGAACSALCEQVLRKEKRLPQRMR